MAILKTGHNPSANSGSGGFVTDEQVTAAKLNTAINSATLESGIADGTTLEVNSGALRIKDNGVSQAKTNFIDGNSVMTLSGTTPKLIFDDTDASITAPAISGDSSDGNLGLTANNDGAEIRLTTNSVLRLRAGQDVAKDAAGTDNQADRDWET